MSLKKFFFANNLDEQVPDYLVEKITDNGKKGPAKKYFFSDENGTKIEVVTAATAKARKNRKEKYFYAHDIYEQVPQNLVKYIKNNGQKTSAKEYWLEGIDGTPIEVVTAGTAEKRRSARKRKQDHSEITPNNKKNKAGGKKNSSDEEASDDNSTGANPFSLPPQPKSTYNLILQNNGQNNYDNSHYKSSGTFSYQSPHLHPIAHINNIQNIPQQPKKDAFIPPQSSKTINYNYYNNNYNSYSSIQPTGYRNNQNDFGINNDFSQHTQIPMLNSNNASRSNNNCYQQSNSDYTYPERFFNNVKNPNQPRTYNTGYDDNRSTNKVNDAYLGNCNNYPYRDNNNSNSYSYGVNNNHDDYDGKIDGYSDLNHSFPGYFQVTPQFDILGSHFTDNTKGVDEFTFDPYTDDNSGNNNYVIISNVNNNPVTTPNPHKSYGRPPSPSQIGMFSNSKGSSGELNNHRNNHQNKGSDYYQIGYDPSNSSLAIHLANNNY